MNKYPDLYAKIYDVIKQNNISVIKPDNAIELPEKVTVRPVPIEVPEPIMSKGKIRRRNDSKFKNSNERKRH